MTLREIEDQREAERHEHVERADDQPVGDVEQYDLRHRRSTLGHHRCDVSGGCRSAAPSCIRYRRPYRRLFAGTSAPTVNTSSASPAWRMHFADEDIRHQFVIAGAITHLAGLQRDVRRQFEILQRRRHFRAVERLRLLRGEPHRVHRHIAEPIARRRRLLGRRAVIGDEFHDLGHVRLIPPPFHVPPAGLRLRRTGS